MMAASSVQPCFADNCDRELQQALDGFMDQLSDQEKQQFKKYKNPSEFLQDFANLGRFVRIRNLIRCLKRSSSLVTDLVRVLMS